MSSAMDAFCGSPFWNSSLLETEAPNLTVCFEQTVLAWAPLAFLWLLAPVKLWRLLREPSRAGPGRTATFSRLYLGKQLVATLLFLVAVAALGVTLYEDFAPASRGHATPIPPVFYVTPCLYMATWILLLVLGETSRRRGDATSGTVTLFWILGLLCGIFPVQTLARRGVAGTVEDVPRFSLLFVAYGLHVCGFVLSSMADPPGGASDTAPSEWKPNPTVSASFLNLITFSWFDKMVYKGYRRPLEMRDLPQLDPEDQAAEVIGQLERRWNWEEQRARGGRARGRARGGASGGASHHVYAGKSTDALVMNSLNEPDVGYGGPGGGGGGDDDDGGGGGGGGGGRKPSLFRAMLRTYKWPLIQSAIFKLIYDLLIFVNPQILKAMILFVDDQSVYTWRGYLYALLLLLTALLQSALYQQHFLKCFLIGIRVRAATVGIIYNKALRISNASRKESTVGEMVNLMSADAQRFMDVAPFVQLLWSAPLQIALSLAFLWLELGPAALAGLGVMVLVIPVNALLATRSRLLQMQNMTVKDERIKMMNEILNGMKILKYFAWEPSFEAMVSGVRDTELGVMRRFSYLTSVSFFIFSLTPFLVSLASFGVYVSTGEDHVLDAQKAFTSLALFNILNYPMAMIPLLISFMVQAGVSVRRMEKFLASEDIDLSSTRTNPDLDCAVRIHNASFSWDRTEAEPTLKDLSLTIPQGSLVAVVGQVGSGKSSLIAALLGEMEKTHGSVEMRGSLAYVPQQAWIQNASLQDNILFGSPMDRGRYEAVLVACALLPDLHSLAAGDLTEIGEKGVNLSGGQKQRVSLARAAYSGADVILLDDPLSAVDAHVAKHLFAHAIGPQGLLRGKTRVLVTHSVSVLPFVDTVVVLSGGRVSEMGSFQQLVRQGRDFAEFLRAFAGGGPEEGGPSGGPGGQTLDTGTPPHPLTIIRKIWTKSHL